MAPSLALTETGLNRGSHLGQEDQWEAGVGGVTGQRDRSGAIPSFWVDGVLAEKRCHPVSTPGGHSARIGHDDLGHIAQRPLGHGAAGQQLVGNLFAGFTAEIQAGSELSQYTASPGFHSDGNSTVTLGPSTFTVTNYVANSLPLTEAACGATTVITSFNLSVGEPQGSGYELVTFIQFDASVTGSGIPTSAVGYVIQIVSVTVASQAGG